MAVTAAPMPEGDSLHRIALRLRPLVGERVVASSPHPRGRLTGVAAAVDGRRLAGVDAVGKHLLLRFEGGLVVHSHLRMSGRWRVLPPGAEPTGTPWLVLRTPSGVAAQWHGPVLTVSRGAPPGLGSDLLAPAADVAALAQRVHLHGAALPIVVALQDQTLVAGIGNLWAVEALWSCRVAPTTPTASLSELQVERLLEWTRREMLAAIEHGRPARAVHRRAGRPCRRCGAPIRSAGVGDDNRIAYWCPRCQVVQTTPTA